MQTIVQGKESYKQLPDILKKLGSKKFLLVCGKNSFDALNVQKFIDAECPEYIRFSDFSPNPKYEQVCKGVELFNLNHCDTIVAIGGGSAMDVAKCIKLFCKMDSNENYLKQDFVDTEIPLVAVPTTAGTGSESTRYAVIYYNDEKQSVTHHSIVPDYAVIDSSLLKTLPIYQKKCAMLDALCQSIESWWSVNSTDKSKEYSKIAVKTIFQNWRQYIFEEDENAAEQIMLASNYAGRAISITQTTAPHAFSYKLTSLYGIPHGHAVAICLPVIWKQMLCDSRTLNDKRGSEYLDGVFADISKFVGVNLPVEAIELFSNLLKEMGIERPVINEDELQLLAVSVNPIRLGNNPVCFSKDNIRTIYEGINITGAQVCAVENIT